MSRLEAELAEQQANHERVMARIMQAKDSWLASSSRRNDITIMFMQTCLFPRCTFTSDDASYCIKFVHLLHRIKTPWFSTLGFFDKLLRDVAHLLFSCTESEASRLGVFLAESFELLRSWRVSAAVYQEQCEYSPGFLASFSSTRRTTYYDFMRVSIKWHTRLSKALATCLVSTEYMEVRNALTVLSKLTRLFPYLRKGATLVLKNTRKIADEDPRYVLRYPRNHFRCCVLHRSHSQTDRIGT